MVIAKPEGLSKKQGSIGDNLPISLISDTNIPTENFFGSNCLVEGTVFHRETFSFFSLFDLLSDVILKHMVKNISG